MTKIVKEAPSLGRSRQYFIMIKIKPLKIYSAVASLLAASNIADALASMGCKYIEWPQEKKIFHCKDYVMEK